MKVLLDETLPRRLKQHFASDFDVRTVADCGWAGTRNGQLLQLAEAEFEAFVTLDGSLEYQQNLANFRIAVVYLEAISSRLTDLLPLTSELETVLRSIAPGTLQHVPKK